MNFGGQSNNIPNPLIAGVKIGTSCYGQAVPLVYGRTRVAPNLIWYGDLQASPISAGKGGAAVTGYNYKAAVMFGLCEGPIVSVPNCWAGTSLLAGPISQYNLTTFLGTDPQTPWSYLTTNHPAQAIGYKTVAGVCCPGYGLDSGASFPNFTFEVKALLAFGSGIDDANPAAILPDFLSDPTHGAGFPASRLGDLSAWSNYCVANGVFLSPAYTTQTEGAEAVKRLAEATNTAIFFSEGKLKAVPYGDQTVSGNGATFTPNTTAIYALTDDDFLGDGSADPVIVTRTSQVDAFNCVQVTYQDRSNNYADSVAEAKDQVNIEMFGLRIAPQVDMREICIASVARNVAQLILQRTLYIRNTYKFKLGWKYCLLEPMDLVTLTESTGTGLSNVPVRITSVTENEDGTLDFEAEDFLAGVHSHVAYPSQSSGGYSGNFNVAPGSASVPLIFDAPGRMTADGFEVWIAVAGASVNWGGANVWLSTDGVSYKQAATVQAPARYGTTTSTLALGSDPDTTDSVGVDLTASRGTLTSGTAQDCDNLNTLCIVEGELISFQTATLTSANKYTLGTRLRRGVYGTAIAAHASGKGFARLDANIARVPYDAALVGKQVWIKLQSFNIFGAAIEDISTVAAYTYTIGGPIGCPADVTGGSATATASGVLLAWSPSTTPNLAQYEIRTANANWGVQDGNFVGIAKTTQLAVAAVAAGSSTWYVKAIDTSGRYSQNALTISFTASVYSAPSVSAQVIDNNVLLTWTTPAGGSQPIKTFEIRRGATWAGAAVIGQKSGQFTVVFETAAGTYTYWVAAIDNGGNYGAPGAVTATVNAPPSYVLKANIVSTFSGALTNAFLDVGAGSAPGMPGVVMPVDTSATYATHFTGNSWSAPQDQVNAGYPIFIEKALASGQYQETIDYGSTLTGCKITASFSGVSIGAPGVQCNIIAAQDAGFTTGVQTFNNATSAYATNFRYVKVQIAVTATAVDLYTLQALSIRLDVKLKDDAGNGTTTSSSADTTVTFSQPFIAITSLTVTPIGTTGAFAIADFNFSTPNPTSFGVRVFNSAGTQLNGAPFSWSAKGY